MSRLNDPASAGGEPFHARRRYSTSRLVTCLLFALVADGAAALHFLFAPLAEIHDPVEVYAALAASAAVAAWSGVGASLGRSLWATVRASLVSAVAAGILFSVIAGARAVVAAYGFTHFDTPEALFIHLAKTSIQIAEALALSPAAIPALIAAAVAGLLGEAAWHAWDRVVIEPT